VTEARESLSTTHPANSHRKCFSARLTSDYLIVAGPSASLSLIRYDLYTQTHRHTKRDIKRYKER